MAIETDRNVNFWGLPNFILVVDLLNGGQSPPSVDTEYSGEDADDDPAALSPLAPYSPFVESGKI